MFAARQRREADSESVFLMKGIPSNESQIRWTYGAVLRSGLGRFFSWLP